MSWHLIGQLSLGVLAGVIANLLTSSLIRRLEKSTKLLFGGYVRITILIILSFLIGMLLAGTIIQGQNTLGGDRLHLALPRDGSPVNRTFHAKGEARGAPTGTYVYLITRDLDTAASPYQVSDVWPVGPNRWWQGLGRVPVGALLGARIHVYAITSETPDFEVGQTYKYPPKSRRKGGIADAVIVKFVGD